MGDAPHLDSKEFKRRLERSGLAADSVVARALLLAQATHANQKRKDGSPYLTQHIYPVAASTIAATHFLDDLPLTPTLIAAALTHDVVEDGDITREAFAARFSDDHLLVAAVDALTKNKDPDYRRVVDEPERTRRYLSRIREAPREARIVKLEDRINNVASLLSNGDSEFARSYLAETERFYLPLAQETGTWYGARLRETLTTVHSHLTANAAP